MKNSIKYYFFQKYILIAVLFLALIGRLLFIFFVSQDPLASPDALEYDKIAKSILGGNPKFDFIGFIRPPLYMLFLSAVYFILGDGNYLAVQIIQALIGALTCIIIFKIAEIIFDRKCAIISALIASVYPYFFYYVGVLLAETLYTFLIVSTMFFLVKIHKCQTLQNILGAGFLMGLTALCRANVILFCPLIIAWFFCLFRKRIKEALRISLLFTLSFSAIITPWSIYNYFANDTFVIVTNGGGINFLIGNNRSTIKLYSSDITPEEYRMLSDSNSTGLDEKELKRIYSLPVSIREREFYKAGFRFIRENPEEWVVLEFKKLIHFWRPWVNPKTYSPKHVIISGIFLPIFLLGIVSIISSWKANKSIIILFLLLFCAATISSVGWLVNIRYRYPLVDPFLIILAANGFQIMLGGKKRLLIN